MNVGQVVFFSERSSSSRTNAEVTQHLPRALLQFPICIQHTHACWFWLWCRLVRAEKINWLAEGHKKIHSSENGENSKYSLVSASHTRGFAAFLCHIMENRTCLGFCVVGWTKQDIWTGHFGLVIDNFTILWCFIDFQFQQLHVFVSLPVWLVAILCAHIN